jgi:hypothetical protein
VLGNGAHIQDNTTSAGTSGGVYMASGDGSTLTMAAGSSITNNKAYSGGGSVFMDGGMFTMNGGTMNNDTAPLYGGGVFVNYGAKFLKEGIDGSGGVISENTATNRVGDNAIYFYIAPTSTSRVCIYQSYQMLASYRSETFLNARGAQWVGERGSAHSLSNGAQR